MYNSSTICYYWLAFPLDITFLHGTGVRCRGAHTCALTTLNKIGRSSLECWGHNGHQQVCPCLWCLCPCLLYVHVSYNLGLPSRQSESEVISLATVRLLGRKHACYLGCYVDSHVGGLLPRTYEKAADVPGLKIASYAHTSPATWPPT